MESKKLKIHWWIPVTVRPRIIFSIGWKVILGITLVEWFVYSFRLERAIDALYELNQATKKRVLTDKMAVPFHEIITSPFFVYIVGLMLLCLVLLPLLFFYQHYIGGKSIYTMLRMKEGKIKLRFYIENVTVSIIGILVLMGWQTLLYVIGFQTYQGRVPMGNQPVEDLVFKKQPLFLMILISTAVLLPAMVLLVALAERSRSKAWVAVLIIISDIIVLYILYSHGEYNVILPVAAVITVLFGLYYINRVQII